MPLRPSKAPIRQRPRVFFVGKTLDLDDAIEPDAVSRSLNPTGRETAGLLSASVSFLCRPSQTTQTDEPTSLNIFEQTRPFYKALLYIRAYFLKQSDFVALPVVHPCDCDRIPGIPLSLVLPGFATIGILSLVPLQQAGILN